MSERSEQIKKFKEQMLVEAVRACEEFGYPSSDETLCILIEDAIDSTLEFANKDTV